MADDSRTWHAGSDRWQQLTNRRPIPPRHLQDPSRPTVPVLIRCVWERDG